MAIFLNNSELAVAIDTAFRMVKETGKYHEDYKIFLLHLDTLLKEMQKRAKNESSN